MRGAFMRATVVFLAMAASLHAGQPDQMSIVRDALKPGVEAKRNAVFSPVSLRWVGGMLDHAAAPAARGRFAKLGDLSVDSLKSLWNQPLKFYNGVWYQNGLTPTPPYKALLGDVFRVNPRAVDFRSNAAGVATEINKIVLEKTDEMIPDAVKASELSKASVVFLNTTLLKSEWAEKFDKKLTRPRIFHGAQDIEAQFLDQEARFEYCESEGLQSLRLARKDGGVIQVILPAEGKDLGSLLSANLAGLQHRRRTVHLFLPKLKIEGKTNCNTLLGVGFVNLKSGFSIGEAPIVIKQAAKAMWDEEGVKMAAVTTGRVITSVRRETVMTVDRPFLFLAVEPDGTISFAGAVFDPTK